MQDVVVDVVWIDCGVSWMKLLLLLGRELFWGGFPSNRNKNQRNSLMNEQNQ